MRKNVKEEGIVTISTNNGIVTMVNEDKTIDVKQEISDQIITLLADHPSGKFKYRVRGGFIEILGKDL